MAEGIVAIVAGVGWALSTKDERYTAAGRRRMLCASAAPILFGVSLIAGVRPLAYAGAALIVVAIADRVITKTPSRTMR
jgi:hypothetical protein